MSFMQWYKISFTMLLPVRLQRKSSIPVQTGIKKAWAYHLEKCTDGRILKSDVTVAKNYLSENRYGSLNGRYQDILTILKI